MIIRHSNRDINQSVQHETTYDPNNGWFQNLRRSSLLRLLTASYISPIVLTQLATLGPFMSVSINATFFIGELNPATVKSAAGLKGQYVKGLLIPFNKRALRVHLYSFYTPSYRDN